MNQRFWPIVLGLSACLLSQANAAERIMQGNTLIGGTGVLVNGIAYDVDLGPNVKSRPFPGTASPFATQQEAEDALNAIFEQLIKDGTGAGQGSLIATKDWHGSPEQKSFGILQTYGNLLAPNQAASVFGAFQTTLTPGLNGAPGSASALLEIRSPVIAQIPVGYSQDGTYPTWTLSTAVPEGSATFMLGAGLIVLGATRKRGSLAARGTERQKNA